MKSSFVERSREYFVVGRYFSEEISCVDCSSKTTEIHQDLQKCRLPVSDGLKCSQPASRSPGLPSSPPGCRLQAKGERVTDILSWGPEMARHVTMPRGWRGTTGSCYHRRADTGAQGRAWCRRLAELPLWAEGARWGLRMDFKCVCSNQSRASQLGGGGR